MPGDKGRAGVARRRRNGLGGLATDVGLGLLDNGGRPGVAWQRRWPWVVWEMGFIAGMEQAVRVVRGGSKLWGK